MERHRICPVSLFYFFTIQLYYTVKALFTLNEDESWQARAFMRVFTTFVPRSNENKSCMRVDWILPRA